MYGVLLINNPTGLKIRVYVGILQISFRPLQRTLAIHNYTTLRT